MAAPVVKDADTTTGEQSVASISWTATYPANIANGDLLLLMLETNQSLGSLPAGWVVESGPSIYYGKKHADGTETGTFTITMSSSSAVGNWVIYRITGVDNVNKGQAFFVNWTPGSSAGGSVVAGSTSGGGTNADPALTTSQYWDSGDDVLWIAFIAMVANVAVTGFPSGYTNTYSVNNASGSIGIARTTSTSPTEDPGTFTLASAASWGAATFAVHATPTFPVIVDADYASGVVTSNSASWTITYSTNIAAGDLLLLLVGADGAGANAASAAGWTDCNSVGTTASAQVLAKIAAGTETGTFSLTMGGSEQGAWSMFRIPASTWFGSGLPTGDNDHSGAGVDSAQTTETTGTSCDPPNLNPGQWGAENTLWILVGANDGTATTSAFPASTFRQASGSSGGAGGANLMFACHTENASSYDPGAFTIGSEQNSAITVAVRPAVVVAAVTREQQRPLLMTLSRAG